MASLSDVEWIFLVLIVLYGLETLVWVRPGVTALTSRWGSFRNRTCATRLTGNERGSLIMGGLLPRDMTLLCQEMPISMSPEGVVAFVPMSPMSDDRPLRSGECFSWQELVAASARERVVYCGERIVCELGNSATAQHVAARLGAIAAEDEAARGAAIERFHGEAFDVPGIGQALDSLRQNTTWLHRLAILLLLWICPLGVLIYYGWIPVDRDGRLTGLYLITFFAIWWLTAAVVYRTHRKLFADDRLGRFQLVACSLLSPAVPLRAIDYLSRQLFANRILHPLAVSRVVDAPHRFRELAERTVRDLEFPLAPQLPANEAAETIVLDSRASQWDAITGLLADSDIDFEDLLMPPIADDDESLAYCPRCHGQFDIADSRCDQCSGLETHAFAVKLRRA